MHFVINGASLRFNDYIVVSENGGGGLRSFFEAFIFWGFGKVRGAGGHAIVKFYLDFRQAFFEKDGGSCHNEVCRMV